MQRAILGLVKGLVVGGGVAYGLMRTGLGAGAWVYLGCAVVGALVGVVCGRPPWKSETIWTPVVKLVVGAIVGVGLCAAGLHALPDVKLAAIQGVGDVGTHGPLLAAVVGLLYGLFVEIDDGGSAARDEKRAATASRARQLGGK